MNKRHLALTTLLLIPSGFLLADVNSRIVAQAEAKKKPSTNQAAAKRSMAPGVTPEREAAVLTFAKEHHPELVELLHYLRDHRTKEYERAVRDLHRASERLATIQERDFERYEIELELWKVQSRIHLLAAKLKMNDDPALRQQLKEILNRQVDLRLAVLKFEQRKAKDRLKKLDEQVKKAENGREQTVAAKFRTLTGSELNRGGQSKAASRRASSRPATPKKHSPKNTPKNK